MKLQEYIIPPDSFPNQFIESYAISLQLHPPELLEDLKIRTYSVVFQTVFLGDLAKVNI